jgi:hypothetical protein
MKNLRSLILMLSLIFGLMVVGCPEEEEEPVVIDDGPETIAPAYQGTFKGVTYPSPNNIIILTKNRWIHPAINENYPARTKTNSEGKTELWVMYPLDRWPSSLNHLIKSAEVIGAVFSDTDNFEDVLFKEFYDPLPDWWPQEGIHFKRIKP